MLPTNTTNTAENLDRNHISILVSYRLHQSREPWYVRCCRAENVLDANRRTKVQSQGEDGRQSSNDSDPLTGIVHMIEDRNADYR